MSALATHLERLVGWLEGIGLKPHAKDVLIVEVSHLNQSDGTAHVRQTDFHEPSDYAMRFDELLQAGYPWLNMSCYGIHDGRLIVAIEIPSPSPLHPGCATSVNLSRSQPRCP
jgi:hypothetical protein